jgi:glutamine amidotransferase-like uncharacterized protein
MFERLNAYRKDLPSWKVHTVVGEDLVQRMGTYKPETTLFVMPAGESTNFDKCFSIAQISFLQEFFLKGGKGFFTCGSAYWASQKRIFHGVCQLQPIAAKTVEKVSRIPLFRGTAEGPLCPFLVSKYKVGYYSDAVQVSNGKNECSFLLSGGGSFMPDPNSNAEVLARYCHSELERLGKTKEEVARFENAAVLEPIGKGAVLLSMFHPYFGSEDIDVTTYEEAFTDSGTKWSEVQSKLSSEEIRMQFVNEMLIRLEKQKSSL